LLALTLTFVATIGEKGQLGSLMTTILYVVVGLTLQFLIGLGLALICAQQIRGRTFFRMAFFLPLMVTPVGIAYTFRMLADSTVGPFQPIFTWLGLAPVSWATQGWSARLVVMVGDAWQWIPFIFIVLLAAIESQPRDQVEAAELDGASGWQIFWDITWPSIAPVAATVVLIRLIEAFKIVDLPNVLTNGGPGIATESLTLHAFIEWRTLSLGSSAAVAYVLLFVSTIAAVSFFNFVVRPARREMAA
jgi:multiple sugar transport system permease protein